MPESVAGTGSDCSIGKTFDVRSIERMQKGSRRGSSFTIVEVIYHFFLILRTCAMTTKNENLNRIYGSFKVARKQYTFCSGLYVPEGWWIFCDYKFRTTFSNFVCFFISTIVLFSNP